MKRKQKAEKAEKVGSILWSVLELHCNESV